MLSVWKVLVDEAEVGVKIGHDGRLGVKIHYDNDAAKVEMPQKPANVGVGVKIHWQPRNNGLTNEGGAKAKSQMTKQTKHHDP